MSVTAEVGDYDQKVDLENLKNTHYVQRQHSLEERILQYHHEHIGMSPADADFQILEISRRLDLYGTRFHLASDREGAKINLSVSHMGVLVFQVIFEIHIQKCFKIIFVYILSTCLKKKNCSGVCFHCIQYHVD
ncbi:hypothetical protein AB205_0000380 [Aquarana catesbeiana]|uniref:FERM domain-containing protein n=1 Tax=Aquarana catesbeiana TaxID=8400 RepID=A0A2G9RJQ7_AQUCT|nr:hypothetical protein AB205_0000380 [Aquarana catesbeiana]